MDDVSVRHKYDILFSIITGATAGIIAWRIIVFIEIPQWNGFSYAWLIFILPIIWIIGLNMGYLFGRVHHTFNQFGRFAVVGLTNSLVDFGYLNILIAYTGIESGEWFSVFKSASFVVANISSYLWNRYWTFGITESGPHKKEYVAYFAVSLLALIVNVTVASVVVNGIGVSFGLNARAWANVGAVSGSAVALIVNFIGYKLLVFKK
ncbi:MAG: GtrA family protein [Parcubacteria group bacterium]